MPTDDERREVARRLRELHPEDRSWWGIHGFDWYMFAGDLLEAIGFDKGDFSEWTEHLADLIEPTCDRDALLEEVKELEKCAWYFGLDFDEDEPLRDRLEEASEAFAGSARRIREALEVES